jgi:hypothetical protein
VKNLKALNLKRRTLLLALALSATSAFAQGRVEFDWVGTTDYGVPLQNPYFHGSLILDASMVYPGSVFWPGADQYPGATTTGMTITSPDHSWSASVYGDGRLDGLYSPWAPSFDLCSHFDQYGHLVLRVYADDGSLRASQDIRGFGEIGGGVHIEQGRWVQAPEPSVFALLGLGLLGLYVKRAACR